MPFLDWEDVRWPDLVWAAAAWTWHMAGRWLCACVPGFALGTA